MKVETKEVENEQERINDEPKKGEDAGNDVENKREKGGRNRGRGRTDQVISILYLQYEVLS